MSASMAPECNDAKERYDTCFLKWYSEKFLRRPQDSKDTRGPDECLELFKEYKNCISRTLKERGLDKLVEDAREDNRENNAKYLRRQT